MNFHISRARLDALTDGVFAITMTLLVIDLRLPETFHPKDGGELIARVLEPWSQFLAYFITFMVLGIRWMNLSRLAEEQAHVAAGFVRWSLLHLLLIGCMPFSTMLLGRYGNLAPSVWIYAVNTVLAALVMIRMTMLVDPAEASLLANRRVFTLLWLIGVALLSVVVSLYAAPYAMLVYLLNLVAPRLAQRYVERPRRRRKA